MKADDPLRSCDKIIAEENRHLRNRRLQMNVNGEKEAADLNRTRFGIALSGGGIRSATINLGLLHTLNEFKILEKSDYLSTVSGGGYTGAYLQAMLKKEASYEKLFQEKHIKHLRSRGGYLLPGTGRTKIWNMLVLTTGYVISTLMSWLGPLIIIFLGITFLAIIGELTDVKLVEPVETFIRKHQLIWRSTLLVIAVFAIHLFWNVIHNFKLGISKIFNHVESFLVLCWLVVISFITILHLVSLNLELFKEWDLSPTFKFLIYVTFAFLIIVLGYFINPNALSFHRFYRNQLAEAFLKGTGSFRNIPLKDLFNGFGKKRDYMAPYPLINTCLNLQVMGGKDDNFKGAKASDYFLLSPLFFGSKLTKYLPSDYFKDYEQMTLPAATTISAAAVNPGMGIYSNKILSMLMTIFNARLGFWVSNPLKHNAPKRVWWPFYFFKELFSQIGTRNQKLNISDGGHIENLGVFELLRRKCRLILVVDAGADPRYTFNDLELLTVRARNELGLEILFDKGQVPEEIIRPKPSHGYSKKRFAVADVFYIWDEIPSVNKAGMGIKDRDNKLFEIVINYSDLKESIRVLDFESKMLVRIIFRVVVSFTASAQLKMKMAYLQINDEEAVKSLIRDEIFSGGTNERTANIKLVIADALIHDPNRMKNLLKKAGLLSKSYPDDVKLGEDFIQNIINNLDDHIGNIEQILLEELEGSPEIIKVHRVVKSFLGLLGEVRKGLNGKIVREILLRKVEDQISVKILKTKGFQEEASAAFLKTAPTDKDLWDWLLAQGLNEEVVGHYMNERNVVRKVINKYHSEKALREFLGETDIKKGSSKSAPDKSFPFSEFSKSDILNLAQVNRIIATIEDEDVLKLWLDRIFTTPSFSETFSSDLITLKHEQEEQITSLMEVVSEKIEERVRRDIRMGTLVYIKSSVKAPAGKIVTDDKLKYSVYKYKIYHPEFPHEPTADQFFDEVQWESYYKLGQYLGGEVLGISGLDDYLEKRKPSVNCSIDDLLYRFESDNHDADMLIYNASIPSETSIKEALPQAPLKTSKVLPEMADTAEEPDTIATPESESEATEPPEQMQEKVVVGKKIDYTI